MCLGAGGRGAGQRSWNGDKRAWARPGGVEAQDWKRPISQMVAVDHLETINRIAITTTRAPPTWFRVGGEGGGWRMDPAQLRTARPAGRCVRLQAPLGTCAGPRASLSRASDTWQKGVFTVNQAQGGDSGGCLGWKGGWVKGRRKAPSGM